MASLQEVINQTPYWKDFLPVASHKIISLIQACHTARLGYHHMQCTNEQCNHSYYQYHSCGNRHCPACGSGKAREWMQQRMGELLPVKYFHVVLTLPFELRPLVALNRRLLFKTLFDAAAYCLLKLSSDPKWIGATPSITAVLHTWGQQLEFHPHIHAIVSGGGADRQHNWVEAKKGKGNYLFPYQVMEPMFKKSFLGKTQKLIHKGLLRLPRGMHWDSLYKQMLHKQWIVYAKPPFGSPAQVVEYLGRYTHKSAISNHRIKKVDNGQVTFTWKDYRNGGAYKTAVMPSQKFLQRFARHILPKGFVRIRHYGLLGNNKRHQTINAILQKMGMPQHPSPVQIPREIELLSLYGRSGHYCPVCNSPEPMLVFTTRRSVRAPPDPALLNNRKSQFSTLNV
jgi:hypothetical protein